MQDTFYVDMKDGEGRWLNLRPHTSVGRVSSSAIQNLSRNIATE
jgi:hypothetical protein